MSDHPEVKFLIPVQGAPTVNGAWLLAKGEDVIAIEMDLHSKYCEVMATGGSEDGPCIWLEANEHSLHLDESKSRDAFTEVVFPEYKGWNVWGYSTGRYTVAICLVDMEKIINLASKNLFRGE